MSALKLGRQLRMMLPASVLAIFSVQACAYVECVVTPDRYFVGSDAILWIIWTQGGAGIVYGNSAGNRGMLATVITAIQTNRNLTIRIPAGASCNAENQLSGMWLVK